LAVTYTLRLYPKVTHDASGARLTMAAAKVAGVNGSHGQRTHVPPGNMRAKLPDYIGQVFECKADNPYYSHSFAANQRGEARRAQSGVRSSELEVPKTLNF